MTMPAPNDEQDALPAIIEPRYLAPVRRSILIVVGSAFICELKPLGKPQVACDFDRMTVAERTLEAIRYSLAQFEFNLGSNGWLRAWVLSTLRVLLLLVIPICGCLVLIALFVPAAAGLAAIFASLESASKSLFWAVVYLILTGLAVAVLIALAGVLLRLIVARR